MTRNNTKPSSAEAHAPTNIFSRGERRAKESRRFCSAAISTARGDEQLEARSIIELVLARLDDAYVFAEALEGAELLHDAVERADAVDLAGHRDALRADVELLHVDLLFADVLGEL